MLRRKPDRYEVVVEVKGRPSIDGVFDEEAMAMERAKFLLGQARFTSVRVAKVNSAGKEETLFEKVATGGGKVTTISHIETAAVCRDVFQVYTFDARMTLLRLLRGYWDEQQVIPTEQLHRYFPLRYLEREAVLFNPAISRLATLQAPQLGVKVFDRQDELQRFFIRIKELAQEGKELAATDQALMSGGTSALLLAAVEHPPEQRDRVITHAFSTALEPHREWRAKVAALLRFHRPGDAESTRLIDEFLAETLDGREPIKALIGYAPDLGTALLTLCATLRGDLDDRLPATDELLKVSDAIAYGGFVRTEEALLTRIAGGLEGTHPLTRHGEAAEARIFQSIADRLIGEDGFRGGSVLATALTRRGKMAMGKGGQDLGLEETVKRLAGRLPVPAARIGYVLDLAGTPYGRRKISFLMEQVAQMFAGVRSAAELALPGMPATEVRRRYSERLSTANVPKALADALLAKMAIIPGIDGGPAAGLPNTMDLSARKVPRLVLSHDDQHHVLAEAGNLRIGRSGDCGIVLTVASASRYHAMVSVREAGFVLEDLSRNGTEVKPWKSTSRILSKGDIIPLTGRGEIFIGSREAGETPARITWEVDA